jgi:hypothetical protein
MKKYITNSLKATLLTAIILAMGFPAFSYAATYAYVNQFGQINTVVADTPSIAIAIAPGIASNSGVDLLSNFSGTVLGATTSATYNVKTFAYVNQVGTVIAISAESSAMAFAKAFDIGDHSGVMLLSNTSGNNGIVGDHVYGM